MDWTKVTTVFQYKKMTKDKHYKMTYDILFFVGINFVKISMLHFGFN